MEGTLEGEEGARVIVANHQSMMDISCIAGVSSDFDQSRVMQRRVGRRDLYNIASSKSCSAAYWKARIDIEMALKYYKVQAIHYVYEIFLGR